jgi:hypothetical protein
VLRNLCRKKKYCVAISNKAELQAHLKCNQSEGF